VTVTDETGGAVAAVDAASDGTYSVDLRPGTYNATADAPDFDTQTVADIAVSPNATASESFALIPQRGSLRDGDERDRQRGDPGRDDHGRRGTDGHDRRERNLRARRSRTRRAGDNCLRGRIRTEESDAHVHRERHSRAERLAVSSWRVRYHPTLGR